MKVIVHPAELCMNDLSRCGKSWFDNERFEIISKHMNDYAEAKMSFLRDELLSEKEANYILTEDVSNLESQNEVLMEVIALFKKDILFGDKLVDDLLKQKLKNVLNIK